MKLRLWIQYTDHMHTHIYIVQYVCVHIHTYYIYSQVNKTIFFA